MISRWGKKKLMWLEEMLVVVAVAAICWWDVRVGCVGQFTQYGSAYASIVSWKCMKSYRNHQQLS